MPDPWTKEWVTQTVFDVEAEERVLSIEVVKGDDTGTRCSFGDRLTIGTASAAGLRLRDKRVSRLHCELRSDPNGVRVIDLGSKNGVWLGKHRVGDAVLSENGRIRVGHSALEIKASTERIRSGRWTGGPRFGELLGESQPMQQMFAVLAKLLRLDSPVLVRGESGTGKELIARALHQMGLRREGPLVIVDGAALSTTLADAELFGHVRGAFTGAEADRAGAFERAHGGTLFLDEIGEVPLAIQPRLLRVLAEGTVQRIGSAERRRVDVRVVAATHRPLEKMVNEGSFREDLFHRLAVISVHVPPLRERGEDVERLARHLLEELAPGDGAALGLLDGALQKHAGHAWPGNVRELRTLVRRMIALGDVGLPRARSDRSAALRTDLPFHDAKAEWVAHFERRYLTRLLDECGGNVSEAARRSGVSRVHLTRLVTQHDLRRKD